MILQWCVERFEGIFYGDRNLTLVCYCSTVVYMVPTSYYGKVIVIRHGFLGDLWESIQNTCMNVQYDTDLINTVLSCEYSTVVHDIIPFM